MISLIRKNSLRVKYMLLALVVFMFCMTTTSLANEPVWDGNTVVLETIKLTNSVFAVVPQGANEMAVDGKPIATTSGFIIGEKGVLVIDSMLNKRLANQLIGLIAKQTDKPILFLVNTSYHGDHSYGNSVFPKTTAIIQHESVKSYVDNNIKEDKAFMIQNFGAGRGIEEAIATTGDIFVEKGGQLKIDLGNRIVLIKDFGFAQTGGDLFVWDEVSKVLWTGNPIVAQKPALPWLLDGHLIETLNTLTAVYEFTPIDAHVVPGHGPVMGREGLKWAIDYLSEIKSQVKDAVKDGLTLEETVNKITMVDFQGYALFGWVHPKLNIPAAYKDLSVECTDKHKREK